MVWFLLILLYGVLYRPRFRLWAEIERSRQAGHGVLRHRPAYRCGPAGSRRPIKAR